MNRSAGELRVAAIGTSIARRGDQWATHHSFGRILALLADRVSAVHYHAPQTIGAAGDMCDFALAHPRIRVVPLAPRRNTEQALRRPVRLLRDYAAMVAGADALFLRGTHPLIWSADWLAAARGKRVVHWFVSDPYALLAGIGRGYRGLKYWGGLGYVRFEQFMTRLALRVARAGVLANGARVAGLYRSPRTEMVISTSIGAADFRQRDDTCGGETIRLLFVGFIRPEKGIEYLLRALPRVRSPRPVRLALVGSWAQYPFEHERLNRLIDELGLRERVSWEGYAEFGGPLFEQLDRADVLVLPTLSEGTPRVLVEARARSVPLVSTNVGGIPSSVTHEQDGLLVPPRDAEALAAAISRVINDGGLRRRLIATGRARVREWTVERFVDRVVDLLVRNE